MVIGFDAKRAFHNFTGLGNYSRFILHALHCFYPENHYHLFTPNVRQNEETISLINNFQIHQAKEVFQVSPLRSFWRSFMIGSEAKKVKLDIYHGLSNELPYSLPKQVKKVVTIHDLIFLRYPEFFPLIDRKIYQAKFKSACKQADKIVAISNQTKQDIISFFNIEKDKIEVLYQGCHSNFLRVYADEERNEISKKYKLPHEFILNVGTIESRKNALVILKALKAGEITVPLVVVGKTTLYKNKLDQFIHENKLEKQVHFLHNVEFEDLPAIYDQSRLFIYPSLFEGFGIPIIEALHRKCPVITSMGSCFTEAGGDIAQYVDPENEDQLAEAINSRLNSSEKLNEDLLAQHLSKFSAKKISSDYMEFYKNLVK